MDDAEKEKIRAAFAYMGLQTQAGLTLEALAKGAGILIHQLRLQVEKEHEVAGELQAGLVRQYGEFASEMDAKDAENARLRADLAVWKTGCENARDQLDAAKDICREKDIQIRDLQKALERCISEGGCAFSAIGEYGECKRTGVFAPKGCSICVARDLLGKPQKRICECAGQGHAPGCEIGKQRNDGGGWRCGFCGTPKTSMGSPCPKCDGKTSW